MKQILAVLLILGGIGYYLYTDYSEGKNSRGKLKPADSEFPAAGICDYQPGETVTVIVREDVPSPRCVKVRADQNLKVENEAEKTVEVSFSNVPAGKMLRTSAEITPNAKYIFPEKFGSYLKPGVHVLRTSLYVGGGGPEIWLTEQ